jgi:hypothetical protein
MAFFYIYRITCDHRDATEKYYYGFRKSLCEPKKDTKYWSSSQYVKKALDQ